MRVERARGRDFTLDVTFAAPPGITILFGPSGSGKTTTLAAIAGLIRRRRGASRSATRSGSTARAASAAPSSGAARLRLPVAGALSAHERARQRRVRPAAQDAARPSGAARADEMLERMQVAHLAERAAAHLLRRRGAARGAGARVRAAAAAGAARRAVLGDGSRAAPRLRRRRARLRRRGAGAAHPRHAPSQRGARARRSRGAHRGRAHQGRRAASTSCLPRDDGQARRFFAHPHPTSKRCSTGTPCCSIRCPRGERMSAENWSVPADPPTSPRS